MKEFKYRIRDLRREKELTSSQLGEQVGLSRSAISCWERGIDYPSVDTLFKLCKIFGVTFDYLLGASDERNPLDVILTEQEKKDIDAGYYVFKDAKDLTQEQRKQIDEYIEFINGKNRLFKDAKDLTQEQRKQVDDYIQFLNGSNKKQG